VGARVIVCEGVQVCVCMCVCVCSGVRVADAGVWASLLSNDEQSIWHPLPAFV